MVRNLSLTGASLVVEQYLEPGTAVALRLVHTQRLVDVPATLRIVYTIQRADGNFIVGGAFPRSLTAEEMQDLLPTRLRGLEVEPHGNVIVAKVLYYSLLDEEANRMVNRQLAGLVETLGQRCFVLDCGQVAGLTSAMLTQLITFRNKVAGAGGQLALCAVTPEVRDLFALSRLDRVIPIYATKQDAVAAFGEPDTQPA
jgi:anti-sigma B factor antagonist